jgi:hypothetical protein
MSQHSNEHASFRPEGLDLSTLSADEIHRLRDAIVDRARKAVDPQGTGFDMRMMATDDGGFDTDDVTFADWWTWVERMATVISEAATRVGLALIVAGGAIAASHLYGSADGGRYAGLTLGVSGVFALWFVVSAIVSAMRGR